MERGNWIYVEDSHRRDNHEFSIPARYLPYVDGIYVNRGTIKDRIRKLAEDIAAYFGDKTITILVVLRVTTIQGGFRFSKDLVAALDNLPLTSTKPYEMEFIKAKSYENDTSSGTVTITGLEGISLQNKHVLVVEDLIDTGRTLRALVSKLREYEPADLKITTLIYKRNEENCGFLPDFLGISVPNEFIVGYHMDYNDVRFMQYFRDFPHLARVNELGKETFRITRSCQLIQHIISLSCVINIDISLSLTI